ncbi:hypothetical protein [Cohnella rhizosphaerae]|uniref:Uncharacterized protein n=1 Tax=Cohnella rhizosphaerae TaxID=1457232 RepID=A0A9X4KTR4_9BACL|nr:hypothetical protein [Cohnella rhizosphaerae]MDG0808674.1 hypothetical protein [Cohnella rhizosphaerae]
MGKFLDLRTSENSNTTGFPNTALTSATVIGVIGLQTGNVANPIVGLNSYVVVSAAAGSTVTANVLRGGVTIYTAIRAFASSNAAADIALAAADLAAPAAAQTVYQLVLSGTPAPGEGTGVTRIGPESFWGIAQNGAVPATPA